ncbi:DUF6059 family protein [Streptomyces aquilus]|uniref:DUF6059 family protein n=1 Tax=Streptomyces aquilus TaxID=2548456 RepID=UPI0036987D62
MAMTVPREGLLIRVIRFLWETLVLYGRVWTHFPSDPSDPGENPCDIPPRHPERLRPDIPLSPFERSVQEQLSRPSEGEGRPDPKSRPRM